MVNEVMGGGLRVLNRIAGSTLVEQLGLEERAQQLVYEGAKRASEAAAKAARRLAPRASGERSRRSMKFDLSLSEEQQLMRDTLRRFADEVMQPAAREADDRSALPEHFLETFSDLGAIAMSVPEQMGGAAEQVSAVSQMLIAEDLARGDMGMAYAALSPLSFVNALVHWGNDQQRARLLPSFLDGDTRIASVAVVEPQPLFDPGSLRTTARKRGSNYVLRGEKSMVALADRANWFLVAAEVP